ncbi:Gfo/Idh/MocA family protein [Pontivivens insulae]|uniref:1,5-anhydro-D-fructose reductase n=1 Tax=Pontivivens insulae TaxID=1639689 RepID=A0A2R8AE30_9RHOB|nr:Gfo/Idh/MocA family oxidoreductase [Pontivivens insulae]RED14435.1 1,5-anhydro-D-fructose reductase (1,5-anhydro-D-mannitol-forming) [Pontivivens insulae]SPF30513.1 1,5-anhydro-D-fructose reductase [Pontivivens insulae]
MKWALIGASTIARDYVMNAIRAQAGHEVHSVLSGSPARGAEYAKAEGIPHTAADLAAALSDPEVGAVYISTTNEKHHAQAMAAIGAGKHVLCEKPLAMTVGEAAEMVHAAQRAGIVFGTNHHLRCSGSHRAIRDLIADGRIGRVLSMRVFHAVHLPQHLQGWRINDASAGGGVIPDITVHDADVARFILGEDPVRVTAQMAASGMGEGVEDSAMSVWTMPSGAMVMAHESFTHPFAGSGLEVHGTEGSIFARGVMTQRPVGDVELVTREGREVVPFSDHDLYTQGLADFAAAIRGEGTPAATGWDGVKSLAVAHAVRAAAAQGRALNVDYGGAQ